MFSDNAVWHRDSVAKRAVRAAEQRVPPPLLARDAAIAVLSPNARHLVVVGIAVVRNNPEFGTGMPKRWKVLFGLAGSSSQPAIDVVGAVTVAAGAGAAFGLCWMASGRVGCQSRADWAKRSPRFGLAGARS